MFPTTLLFAAAVATAGDGFDARFVPLLEEGCIDGPAIPALDSESGQSQHTLPSLQDLPMSGRSIRFFTPLDNPKRHFTTLVLQLDSGLRRSLGANGEPFLLAIVTAPERTCTVRMPFDACPEAAGVFDALTRLQIPVGHGMGELDRITLHPPMYLLQFHGDELNQVKYYQPGNPLERPLTEAKDALRACWEPALQRMDAG